MPTFPAALPTFQAERFLHEEIDRVLFHSTTWSDDDADAICDRVDEASIVSVGGGLGSFALVDALRIGGVPREEIRVLGLDERPYGRLKELLDNSQVPASGRMRSDSAARIDCPWGWPGYAMGEARRRRSPGPLVRVVAEPVLCEFFTPTAGQVYEGVDRECARIGWPSMLATGAVRAVRRRKGGGYFALQARAGEVVAWRSRNLHVAPGYSTLCIAPSTHEFRDRFPGDSRVVHAYEPHEDVFSALQADGGRVVVRGAGITALQEIQRLVSVRNARGSDVRILHLLQDSIGRAEAFPELGRGARRPRHGVTYQNFVFPRGAHGGQVARRLERLGPEKRTKVIEQLGTATAPSRRAWDRELAKATREGWYVVEEGVVDEMIAERGGGVKLSLRTLDDRISTEIVGFVIDATGLECSVDRDPLLSDMVGNGIGSRNPLGRLTVDEGFVADRNPDGGRLYASGPITLGGEVAPVDSFWGLTEAAFRIVGDLAREGAIDRLGSVRSAAQWWKWMRGTVLP